MKFGEKFLPPESPQTGANTREKVEHFMGELMNYFQSSGIRNDSDYLEVKKVKLICMFYGSESIFSRWYQTIKRNKSYQSEPWVFAADLDCVESLLIRLSFAPVTMSIKSMKAYQDAYNIELSSSKSDSPRPSPPQQRRSPPQHRRSPPQKRRSVESKRRSRRRSQRRSRSG